MRVTWGWVGGMDEAMDELRAAVEKQHGVRATLSHVAHVHDVRGRRTVWDGPVHVFDLDGHPTAKRAYAWSRAAESGGTRFFAMLQTGDVTSPADAVRKAMSGRID